MALVTHIYRFKGDDRLHLAVELTSIKPTNDINNNHNYCDNYISYYSYKGSETEKLEKQMVYNEPLNYGCSFNADLEKYAKEQNYLFQQLGFAYSSKQSDQENMIIVNRIVIPTQEDGLSSSPYQEAHIRDAWSRFLPASLSDAKKNFKNNLEILKFDIKERHCGTIVQNILNYNKPLQTPIPVPGWPNEKDSKDEPGKKRALITASLHSTIQNACEISQVLLSKSKDESKISFENCYLKHDLQRFYDHYRKSMFSWQSSSNDYRALLKLCYREKDFISEEEIPSAIKSSLDHYLNRANTYRGTVHCVTPLGDEKQKIYPKSYYSFFSNSQNPVQNALALLTDYAADTLKNKILHPKRTNTRFISGLITEIASKKHKYRDIESVVSFVKEQALFKTGLTVDGSVERRLSFLSHIAAQSKKDDSVKDEKTITTNRTPTFTKVT